MIGGIFETIGKTLGVGKEKYFLELDDAAKDGVKNVKQVATKVAETAKEASADVAEKAQELIDETGATADKVTDTAKAAAKKVEKQAKPAAASKKKANAQKGKTASGKKGEAQAPPVQKSAPAAAPTSSAEEDLIVAAIAATAKGKTLDNQGNVVAAETTTFATDYLPTPSRASRRRPGPSLSPFKGMAKEVNPRLRG